MLKFILGIVVGLALGVGGMVINAEPKQVFSGIRKGVDKVEQIQVSECRESEASCYLSKTQTECDALIKLKCGG